MISYLSIVTFLLNKINEINEKGQIITNMTNNSQNNEKYLEISLNQSEVNVLVIESDIILWDDPSAVCYSESDDEFLFNVSVMNFIGNNPTTIITHDIITIGFIFAFVTAPTMNGVMKLPS